MVTKQDLAIYVYNYAVLISGAYVILGLGFEGRVQVFVAGAVIALFWTVYFKWAVVPKIVGEGDEDEEESPNEEFPGEA